MSASVTNLHPSSLFARRAVEEFSVRITPESGQSWPVLEHGVLVGVALKMKETASEVTAAEPLWP